ncbi:MAG: NAD(P)-dependent oxidoreductase [Patescibacteria group bacterium]
MANTARAAFEQDFDVDVFPNPPRQIALTDGVADKAVSEVEALGFTPVDLREMKPADAIRKIEGLRVSAVLGRGGMDKALKTAVREGDVSIFSRLRDSGVLAISRAGNGVDMDRQRAFDSGVIVTRTPRGNAEAVRIWQDLQLAASTGLATDPDKNPAIRDNALAKKGGVEKLGWDRTGVTGVVDPDGTAYAIDNQPTDVERASAVFADKKIAVIGAGRIGQEVISKSTFLYRADVHVYDPFPPTNLDTRVTIANSMEEALADAELVMLHLDGENEILTGREFAMLKDGATVCNMARGGCINPRALYEALASGKIKAACLDTHAVEGDDLLPFMNNVPVNKDEIRPGHWAHMLRQHPKCVAGNHSAASERQAQSINAVDGVRGVAAFIERGEIVDGVCAPTTEFPYTGFVEGDNGRTRPIDTHGRRFALELIHDGNIPGLLDAVRRDIARHLTGKIDPVLDLVSGELAKLERGGRRNGVDFHAIELPEGVNPDDEGKIWREIARRAESTRGVRLARVFVPKRKKAA